MNDNNYALTHIVYWIRINCSFIAILYFQNFESFSPILMGMDLKFIAKLILLEKF